MPPSLRPALSRILLVAEKPIQGREIAAAIIASERIDLPQGGVRGRLEGGEEIIVAWAEGHLMEMAKPDDLRPEWGSPWRKEVLPMIPADGRIPRRPIAGRTATLDTLAAWMRQASEIVNACDAGPEGELIFDEIATYANFNQDDELGPVKFSRMWIDDTRREALLAAFTGRRRSNLVRWRHQREAAYARADADWLYGFNCTRFATCAMRRAELPLLVVGRVQTPTLGAVATRDLDILTFVPEPFDYVPMTFRGESGRTFEAFLVAFPHIRHGNVDHHFHPGPELRDIRQELLMSAATPWRVMDMPEPRAEHPPAPFDLIDLQRSAFNIFRWPAARTLQIAQSLYAREKAITYPRTDSNKIPPGMRGEVEAMREKLYYGWALDRFPNLKGAVLPTEEAHWAGAASDHHAIIPTGPVPQAWDRDDQMRDEYRLWELIAVRTVLAWLPPASIASVTRQMMRPWTKDTVIRASIEAEPVDDPGWLWWEDKMMNTRGYGPPLSERMREIALPDAGKVAVMVGLNISSGQTSPAKYFDESSLLGWMQRAALGTAATRAQVIEELIRHSYMVRSEAGQIRATHEGAMMISMFKAKLEDEVTGHQYARQTEEFLERIGGMAKDRPTRERLWESVEARVRAIGAKLLDQPIDLDVGYCPKTGHPGKLSADGKYYTFAGFKDARFFTTILSRKMTAVNYADILAGESRGAGPFEGFTSKKGNAFSAYLAYAPKKKRVELMFKR